GEGLRLPRRGGRGGARGRAHRPLHDLHRPRHGGAAACHRLGDLSDLRRPRELRGAAPRGGGARGPHGELAGAARRARDHLRRAHHPHHALPPPWTRGRGARPQGQGMAAAARGAPPGPGPVSGAALLELTGLTAKRNELVENLNFGERRRLEMARALATEPRLLLLDEPAAGMGALELERLTQDIRRLRELGATIFLIEHTMDLVMGVADRIAVLNFGHKIAEGAPGELQTN